jgi:DNA-binding NtrC family response regulator
MKAIGKCGHNIAILDSDPAVMDYVRRILTEQYNVSTFTETRNFLNKLGESPSPDLLLMDWHIDEDGTEENAFDLLARIHTARPSLPIILFACTFGLNDAVAATRMGVARIILKPFKCEDIEQSVQECLKERGRQLADDDVSEVPLDENTSFVRASKRMREIESQCTLVARADIPVLILGESGTGKEVAAMLIHKMSARSQRSFLKVNCAAMPADLLESELFGYEQGAFTGAVKSKPGKFEICNGGTILLDEIGEMPNALQAKLLQVLQDGSFSRLGSRSTVKVDVRVIAATNIDIKTAIAQKVLREDLYYRLNGFTVKMPPLRERVDEIPILSQHFMRKGAAKYECDPLPISPALLQALTSYPWPGNLRELENTVKRYLVLADEQAIIDELSPQQSPGLADTSVEEPGGDRGLKHMVRNLKGGAESAAIERTLEGTGWNRKAAASDLQISYKALLYKIKQYNLTPPQKRRSFARAQ